jgi:diamine N-acetyltransferase
MEDTTISIRALEPTDIDLLYDWENDPEVWHLGNTIAPFSRFVLEQYLVNSHEDIFSTKQLRLMIEYNDGENTAEAVGSIDLFEFEPLHRRVGIGILIAREHRRKGYAKQALKLMLDYCYNTLNIHQVFCNIEADNHESIRLFTKLGFVECGHKKQWLWRNHVWVDEIMYQHFDHHK